MFRRIFFIRKWVIGLVIMVCNLFPMRINIITNTFTRFSIRFQIPVAKK